MVTMVTMSPFVLAGLMMFNAAIAEYREKLAPDARIFVGVQPGGDGMTELAWTKCVPESPGVYVAQASVELLSYPQEKIELAAAHEVCHIVLHPDLVCTGQQGLRPFLRSELEHAVDRCAVKVMAR